MNLIVEKRKILLASVKDSLEAVPQDNRAIYLLDASGTTLCTIFFGSVSDPSTTGDKATYLFKSIDDSVTLRGSVDIAGAVKTFRIMGVIPPSSIPIDNFITGTVGGLSSSADMKFNKTTWSEGMNITISNLYLVMR
jgi:hypothetical protein